jgi:hypothetical protein
MTPSNNKWEWNKWVIGLLFLLTAATATNSAFNTILMVRVNKIQEEYVRSEDVIWFMRTYDAEKKTMILYAAKDSLKAEAAIKASDLYNELRNEAFKIMLNTRGASGNQHGSANGGSK